MAHNYSIKKSKQFSRTYSVIALAIAFVFHLSLLSGNLYAQKKEKDKELDGKIFTIQLTEEGKKAGKEVEDEVSFKSNKFKSKVMFEKNKFGPGEYTVTVDSSNAESRVVTFEAESKIGSDELLTWEGTITGEEIEGTAVWTKKGKTKKEYSFTGTLKQKQKKK